jgi:copper oxidase (laccase) domain-containing protein
MSNWKENMNIVALLAPIKKSVNYEFSNDAFDHFHNSLNEELSVVTSRHVWLPSNLSLNFLERALG